ncbi:hypothetical protein ACFOY4_01225 [Actinomadura syzygii]|uniref:DUF732 domain-containing protein n=1 Tax=Actinomadura syzygii TaxID=1427538 RepID=A0A5D0TR65_9ACTN|nr:hypothetical protein [Actinomadura syzygii]TYC08628.1 hypothetical protein FXF65_37690 [Actinomadura syzygii]
MKRAMAVSAAAAVLVLGSIACGSDSRKSISGHRLAPSAAGTSPNTSRGHTPNEDDGPGADEGGELTPAQKRALAKAVECMRNKGYTMPEPTSPVIAPKNIDGMDPTKVNRDAQECAAQAAR